MPCLQGLISNKTLPFPIGKNPSCLVSYVSSIPIDLKSGNKQFTIESFGGLLETTVPPYYYIFYSFTLTVKIESFSANIRIGIKH
jgi:hypothetical protein